MNSSRRLARQLFMSLTLACLIGLLGYPRPCAASERKNVLFIVSDDLTNNALSCYGGAVAKSPQIDRLASRGVRFDRAYCQFPLCNPSRSSFMTGLRPDTTRVYDNAAEFRKLRPQTQTLPQTFRKAGYFVARVGKLYHYGVPSQIGTSGLDDPASWDHVVNPRGKDKDDEPQIFSLSPGNFGGTVSWLAAQGTDAQQTDGLGAAATIKLLEEKAAQPFFIACGFYRPHTPYVAPRAYFDLHPIERFRLPEVDPARLARGPAPAFASAKREQDRLKGELGLQAIQAYHASTTFMDAQLGLVLDALDRLKLADKTIVVFFSDHGYHLGEHGLWQKMSLFENSARVPLIIYAPGAAGNGKACGRTVELSDLHATLADLCGIQAPATDGVSLAPLIAQPDRPWDRPALTQVTRGLPRQAGAKKPQDKGKDRSFMGYSLRTEQHRLTVWGGGEHGVELYDYATDPLEQRNLASDPAHAQLVESLRKQLELATARATGRQAP